MPRTPDELERAAVDAAAWLENLSPSELDAEDMEDLRRIARARASLVDAEAKLWHAVDDARNAGRSWERIMMALGVANREALERFDIDPPDPDH